MGRGRRPTEEVRRDVLAAAGRLLREEGMAGFTIEKVAAASGASKVTIYKLWPSRGTLAMEGYFASVERELRFPDTGDVEADLRTQLHAFVALLHRSEAGRAISELIGEAQTDPALREAYLRFYSRPRRDLAVARLRTGMREGQLRTDLDCESVVDQLWGACYHRLLLPDEPLDTAFADQLVDNLFRGISTNQDRSGTTAGLAGAGPAVVGRVGTQGPPSPTGSSRSTTTAPRSTEDSLPLTVEDHTRRS